MEKQHYKYIGFLIGIYILFVVGLFWATHAHARTLNINACWPDGTTVSCVAPVSPTSGGTGLTSGTSGGVPYFSSTTTLASSALLTNHTVMLGGGAAAAPKTIGIGTTGQLLVGVTLNDPAFSSTVGAATTFSAGTAFGGTTTAASGASGTQTNINWYEEGTWTPVLTTSGTDFSSVTYSTQVGFFRRIGNVVYYQAELVWTNTSGSPSGGLQLSGLPYPTKTASGLSYPASITPSNMVLTSTAWTMTVELDSNSSRLGFRQTQSGAADNSVTASSNGGAATRSFILTGIYFI